jgi:cyclopropane fatty-acyl-phospholipid synthase-like methyltransferase
MLIFWMIESPLLIGFIVSAVSAIFTVLTGGGWLRFIITALLFPPLAVLSFVTWLVLSSRLTTDGGAADWEEFLVVKDKALAQKYHKKKIPMYEFVEGYMAEKIDIKGDPYEVFLRRNQLFRMNLTLAHMNFYIKTFLRQNIGHGIGEDNAEIAPVYNCGNDFYANFLGPTMVYTSGIWRSQVKGTGEGQDTLEEAQKRKIDTVCRQLQLKPGEDLLDIGCGWGTLLAHAAKNYKVNGLGVTLADEQRKFFDEKRAPEYGVQKQVQVKVMDYRNIPHGPNDKKFDKITCLEMAEHVGIKNFQAFLQQVDSMLKDDGLFYLQIAGLRRKWQFEDLVWGLFMGRYIFPAADASCPLGFVISQLERAGFEVHRVENCGVHYSLTIKSWYDNWIANKDKALTAYRSDKTYSLSKGKEYWYRLWTVFLAWSTCIAAQGSSTVFMITCNKNTAFDKSSVKNKSEAPFSRMDRWVGPEVIGHQQ